MDVILPMPGAYVIGVSGGVDSMVLLNILHKHSKSDNRWKLIVAHMDHGIRNDSAADRKFVQSATKGYGLPFVYKSVKLGEAASEARAREERYLFLNHIRETNKAQALITAHHQDDLLETAIINILRGSGRKGMTSLSSRSDLIRPLLNVPKAEIISYANKNGLEWREDSTNKDDAYLRNYIRHNVLSRFDAQSRSKFLKIINNMQALNSMLDDLLKEQLELQEQPGTINRLWFNSLPHNVAKEVLASWLRSSELTGFDSKMLELLVINAKVGHPGQEFPVRGKRTLKVKTKYLALEPAER